VSPAIGIPGRIRIGDIDADGYPDILITVNKLNASGTTQSLILINKEASTAPQVLQLKKSLQDAD
jgi:hypothetical protein